MKNLIKKVHLYFGLVSSIFVLLIALSGTAYVFNDEIIHLANKKALTIAPSNKPKLAIDSLLQIVKDKGYEPTQFIYNKDLNRSFFVLAEDANGKSIQLYINPYTGEILKTSQLYHFFNFIESFHTELFLDAPGRAFIGIITALFFILSITGIVLWYPKRWNEKTVKNSFTMKFGGNKTVINYNMHKILGFYIVIPAIVLSITGTIMAFDPLEIGILKIVKADKDYESYIDALMTEAVPDSAQAISYQSLIENESHSENEITELRVTIPDIENGRFVLCESGNNFGMKYSEDYRFKYIDRSDGNALNLSEKTNQSLEIKKGISQLHTGKMMGLPYKIILFVAGIIMTSLPVTGFIIWYKKVRGKTKSNQKRNKK